MSRDGYSAPKIVIEGGRHEDSRLARVYLVDAYIENSTLQDVFLRGCNINDSNVVDSDLLDALKKIADPELFDADWRAMRETASRALAKTEARMRGDLVEVEEA